MGKLADGVKAFIPQHIHNGVVLYFFNWLSRHTGFVPEQRITEHAAVNRVKLGSPPVNVQKGAFVENQSEWGGILFGEGKKANMSYSGCGIIAVYNALVALGEPTSAKAMEELISGFERNGAAWRGRFGVAPTAIYDYFASRKFQVVKSDTKDAGHINEIGKAYDVAIATVYNDRYDITAQIHTVCMTKEADGAYVIHNAYNKCDGNWAAKRTGKYSLGEAIVQAGRCPAAVCVIGIKKIL